MAEHLEYLVSLKGGTEAAAQARELDKAVESMGGKVRKAGEDSRKAAPGFKSAEGGIRGVGKALVAAGAGFAAWEAGKQAFEFTHELVLGTKRLSSATHMSTQESSRWIAVTKAVGGDSKQTGMAFQKLATSAQKQTESTIKQVNAHKLLSTAVITGKEPLEQMGISTAYLQAHQHNLGPVMEMVVNRLDHMSNATQKGAILNKLFGRGWQALSPLLLEGGKHLHHLLEEAKLYGVEIGNTKGLEEFRERQIDANLATEGLKLRFTELAAKPMAEVLKGFSAIALAIKTGDWKEVDRQALRLGEVFSHVAEAALPRLAETFGHMAPILLSALWRGFQHSSLGGEAVIVAVVAHRLGIDAMAFSGMGKLGAKAFAWAWGRALALGGAAGTAIVGGASALGGLFVGAFETSAIAALYAWDAVAAFAGPAVMAKITLAGGIAGTAFQVAFLAGVAVIGFVLGRKLGEWLDGLHFHVDFARILHGKSPFWVTETATQPQIEAAGSKLGHHLEGKVPLSKKEENTLHSRLTHKGKTEYAGAAAGASILRAGLVEVGEQGRELVHLPQGAEVEPLKPGSLDQLNRDVVVNVDGRRLFRVNLRQAIQEQAAGA